MDSIPSYKMFSLPYVRTDDEEVNNTPATREVRVGLLAYVNGERKFAILHTHVTPHAVLGQMHEDFAEALQYKLGDFYGDKLDVRVVHVYVM